MIKISDLICDDCYEEKDSNNPNNPIEIQEITEKDLKTFKEEILISMLETFDLLLNLNKLE